VTAVSLIVSRIDVSLVVMMSERGLDFVVSTLDSMSCWSKKYSYNSV